MGKRNCHYCQTDQYNGKYAEHLKGKHPDIIKAREVIKNIIKTMEIKQLKKAIDYLYKIRKEVDEKPTI